MEKQNIRDKFQETLEQYEPRESEARVKALFDSKTPVTPEVLAAIPKILNSQAQMLKAFSDSLEQMPEDKKDQLMKDALHHINGVQIGQAINAFSQTVIQSRDSIPAWSDEANNALTDAMQEIDFGKLRVAMSELSGFYAELGKRFAEVALEDPVMQSNLLIAVMPVLNNSLSVVSHALSKVDLPPEILATVLFRLIQELDTKEVGRAINRATNLVKKLHEGNMVLGRDEPRFKAVFSDVADDIFENLDPDNASAAITALAEDVTVMAKVLVDHSVHDPKLMPAAVRAYMSMVSANIRIMSYVLNAAKDFPDQALDDLAKEVTEGFDAEEVAHIINSWSAFHQRFMERNPEFCLLDGVIQKVDSNAMFETMQRSTRQFHKALEKDSRYQKALEPKNLAKSINGYLASFNALFENKAKDKPSYLKEVFAGIDSNELEKATRNLTGGITDALYSNAKSGMAVLRPIGSAFWKTVRFMFGALKRKIFGRG